MNHIKKNARKIINFFFVFSLGFITNVYITFITKKMFRKRIKVHDELAEENKEEAKELVDMLSDSSDDDL